MSQLAKRFVSRLLQAVEVHHDEDLTHTHSFLTNDDLRPVPSEKRTWKSKNYCALWLTDGFNINTWMVTSSMIQRGLSWWQAWICVWVAYGVVAPFIVLNARPGAVFHITFPIVARASFGIWGSMWCILNRAAMACILYGVQANFGGDCVLVSLRAIWPNVNNIPNSMSASSGTTTRDIMCFFLFWLISLPAIWPPIHKIRHLFVVKAIVVPIAAVAFFIWCIVKAHGVGPIVHQPGSMHGPELCWAMMTSVMSCLSTIVTLLTNAPDFASRARKPSDAVVPQLVTIPISYGIVSFLGIIVSSSSQAIYGRAIWSPIDLLGMFLDDSPSHAARFGVWFIATAFIIAQIGTNISANTISAGCDLTALFPRFINIRRGGYIAAIVGFCICPWKLLGTSSNFTTYLSAYCVFLSSFAGVMVTDYWLIHKGHYRVRDLYSADKTGWYQYTYGVNLRHVLLFIAYGGYISGVLINVVGFAGAAGRVVPLPATHIYQLSFFTGFGVSALVYWTLNQMSPAKCASLTFKEIDLSDEADESDSVAEGKEKEKEALSVDINVTSL
ncbi:hypothetical protein WOLCODRAFT_107089 [Wolfiporia cocos MD-104 SS10]|uniref:NCS1 nucleoside transporter family n=1 Tax=Wolfiporia cocos (strain MD-104) TaxID=742152 RepID=A0A2H3JGR2_WOLCO|nr:hypothetical protein WOLCODRAFT_107089 [Wolfiporia cocos MD-104 SS10]